MCRRSGSEHLVMEGLKTGSRRSGLRAVRFGLSQLSRHRGFQDRARRIVVRRIGGIGRSGAQVNAQAPSARAMSVAPASKADAPASIDARFMDLALMLGRRGPRSTWPNPAVGAVIGVRGRNVIVGRGWTRPTRTHHHAEVEALRRAGSDGARRTLYVTLEPCSHHGKSPPCADAVIAGGVARVVSALRGSRSRGRGRRDTPGCARPAMRWRSASAPTRRGLITTATSAACATAVPQ